MSHNRFLHSVASILVAYTSFSSSGCWSGQQDIDYRETVCGFLGTAAPIVGAYIDVYQLNERTGELVSLYPIASTQAPTNADGEFCFNDVELSGALLFRARGGEIHEYWSPEPAQLGVKHLATAVEHWVGQRDLTITPWTTLAYEIATARYRNGEENSFYAAVLTAERLLYAHFIGGTIPVDSRNHCDALLNCLRPTRVPSLPGISTSPESDRYTVTLLSLSSLAFEWSGQSISTKNLNSVDLTTIILSSDAADGRFDGLEIDQPLMTTVNTLRSDLARALAIHDSADSAYSYIDHRATFERMASNTDPRLFGEGAPEPIDAVAPTVFPMSSPIFDERDDRIIFDNGRIPIHIHTPSSVISLDSVFEAGCPEIHKHVNLLNGTDAAMNPLQWRFTVRDDITGLANVRAEISSGPYYPRVNYADVVTVDESFPDGSYQVIVTVTADNVPELLSQEGEFRITIVATDGAGNESAPLEGCWHHVPRAAPLWVGPVSLAGSPESIHNYSLEGDNLSPILNESFSLQYAPVLASFEVFNPNSQVVFLSMTPKEISGVFAWTWNYDYTPGQRNQGLDSCIKLEICESDIPQSGYRGTPLPNPGIPISGVSLTATDSLCGEDCSNVLIAIEPSKEITVQVRWSDFELMLPDDVSPGELEELDDPVDGQGLATGINRTYVHCIANNGDGTCSERQFYEEHITMRAARLDIQGAVTGWVSSDPFLPLRKPAGQQYTFGIDHEFRQDWFTYED